jgi:hypothetical protein
LRNSVDEYVGWKVFAYWARAALDQGDRLPERVKREVRRRCPGFLEVSAAVAGGDRGNKAGQGFNELVRWIERLKFARARKEGWLPVLLYQAHLHARHARVIDYWRHWNALRLKNRQSPYPSFERWRAASDAFILDTGRRQG